MKRIIFKSLFLGLSIAAMAGGPGNNGTKGAMELTINPWAGSSGWNGINNANVKGVEAFNLNIGGLSNINSTNINLTYTDYLHNAGIKINAFGIAQKLGSSSYIGISYMSMNFGDIQRTDVNNPDGGIGTYSPRFNNFGIGYTYKFSNAISCGLVFRGISEIGAADVKARTASLDAGVQYSTKTSKKDEKAIKGEDFHFGISLRNVGPNGSFSGDGLASRITDADNVQRTMQIRTASFQLPTQLLIGLSYDIKLDKQPIVYNNRLTLAANYSSNSYANNQFGLGFEYGYKRIFALRAGYQYEAQLTDMEKRINAFSGIAAGASIYIPLKKASDNLLAFDYSYRDSRFLGGTNSLGIRLEFGESSK